MISLKPHNGRDPYNPNRHLPLESSAPERSLHHFLPIALSVGDAISLLPPMMRVSFTAFQKYKIMKCILLLPFLFCKRKFFGSS